MEDIWPLILENLHNIREIIRKSLVNKLLLQIVKQHNWYIYVYIPNNRLLEYVLNNYHFKKLAISLYCDVNKFINKLTHCHTLDLSNTNITDESVKKLIHCTKLYLFGTLVTEECKHYLRDNHVNVK
jgi:hypothetical protein